MTTVPQLMSPRTWPCEFEHELIGEDRTVNQAPHHDLLRRGRADEAAGRRDDQQPAFDIAVDAAIELDRHAFGEEVADDVQALADDGRLVIDVHVHSSPEQTQVPLPQRA